MSEDALIICDISNRGRLKMTGEDRVRFLNGQVTNDVKTLAPLVGCYAALTNAKGKMRADLVILNSGNEFLIDVEPGLEQLVCDSLSRYIIADDVQVEIVTQEWNAFTLVGSKVSLFLKEAGLCSNPSPHYYRMVSLNFSDGTTCSLNVSDKALTEQSPPPPEALFQYGFLFRSFRARTESFDIWVKSSKSADFLKSLSKKVQESKGKMGSLEDLEILRVEAGIPKFGVEMNENTMPNETGLESRAVSYSKGCYIGQEVIARIKSVGHVNRQLIKLKFQGQVEKETSLLLEDKEVGKVGSCIKSPLFGWIGLAVVRREAALPNGRLRYSKGEAIVVEDFG